MSSSNAPTPPSRPRNREAKLYQSVLEFCIAGFSALTVSPAGLRRRVTASVAPSLNLNNKQTVPNTPRTVSLSSTSTPVPRSQSKPRAATSLLSTPPSPGRCSSAPSLSSPAEDSEMNRLPPNLRHPAGAPTGPAASRGYGSQDARSNLAVQPVAAPAKISLRKAAVKIVGAAPLPAAASRNVAAPVLAPAKVEDAHEPRPPVKTASSSPQVKIEESETPKIQQYTPMNTPMSETEKTLDEMYARLLRSSSLAPRLAPRPKNSGVSVSAFNFRSPLNPAKDAKASTPAKLADTTEKKAPAPEARPSIPKKKLPAPEKKLPTPEKHATAAEPTAAPTILPTSSFANGSQNISATAKPEEGTMKALAAASKPVSTNSGEDTGKGGDNMYQEEVAKKYLQLAAEFLASLPAGTGADSIVRPVQTAIDTFRSLALPDGAKSREETDALMRNYVAAIATYLSHVPQNIHSALGTNAVSAIFDECKGNFLQFCSKLVDEKALNIENLSQFLGLCHVLNNVQPTGGAADVKKEVDTGARVRSKKKEVDAGAPMRSERKDIDAGTPVKAISKAAAAPNQGTPKFSDKIAAWPAQQKRENVAGVRICILKGISSLASINKLQAYVWGGRLEAIAFEPGKANAVIRFLTPEGCQKYFDATANGIPITLPDGNEALMQVEKTPGPQSLNDVLKNCIEGDASRCVRALDADQDWQDIVLLNLARGKGQSKREVDRIKRGRTPAGRYYIEFRFSNIMHALAFKRVLYEDEDWEKCTITYAKDPCETARGVHLKDEDEAGGFF
ncbi:hypothetical protein BCR34DRAFT_588370 [Clohesyomyces aquaticus]|uniref:Uncharacterized protein n=1 Tax=Clohesyomyces aquaticus TaxID=1231657 RepID=A0A1Y1ZKG3_9PLEO|nr:hypothetical protein BCR34DRAFT_588370 [Clohesyomyces aquaticus]